MVQQESDLFVRAQAAGELFVHGGKLTKVVQAEGVQRDVVKGSGELVAEGGGVVGLRHLVCSPSLSATGDGFIVPQTPFDDNTRPKNAKRRPIDTI